MKVWGVAATVWLLICLPVTAKGAWDYYLDGSELPAYPWVFEGYDANRGDIVYLGEGNAGFQMSDDNYGPSGYREYYLATNEVAGTLGARFRLDAADTSKSNVVQFSHHQPGATDWYLAVGIRGDHYYLVSGPYMVIQIEPPPPDEKFHADLGPAVPGIFHEAYIYVNQDTCEGIFIWDGAEILRQPPIGQGLANTDLSVEFGAGTSGATDGASTVTFDWVGFTRANIVPEPSSFFAVAVGLCGLAAGARLRRS